MVDGTGQSAGKGHNHNLETQDRAGGCVAPGHAWVFAQPQPPHRQPPFTTQAPTWTHPRAPCLRCPLGWAEGLSEDSHLRCFLALSSSLRHTDKLPSNETQTLGSLPAALTGAFRRALPRAHCGSNSKWVLGPHHPPFRGKGFPSGRASPGAIGSRRMLPSPAWPGGPSAPAHLAVRVEEGADGTVGLRQGGRRVELPLGLEAGRLVLPLQGQQRPQGLGVTHVLVPREREGFWSKVGGGRSFSTQDPTPPSARSRGWVPTSRPLSPSTGRCPGPSAQG